MKFSWVNIWSFNSTESAVVSKNYQFRRSVSVVYLPWKRKSSQALCKHCIKNSVRVLPAPICNNNLQQVWGFYEDSFWNKILQIKNHLDKHKNVETKIAYAFTIHSWLSFFIFNGIIFTTQLWNQNNKNRVWVCHADEYGI